MSTDSVFGYEKKNVSFNNNGNYKPFGMYGKSKKDFEDYLVLKGKEKKIIYTIIRGFLFFDRNLFKKICQINSVIFKPIYLPNFFGFIFRKTFNLLTKLGFNNGGLFTLSKLNLTITSKDDSLSKDTQYKQVINFKKIN